MRELPAGGASYEYKAILIWEWDKHGLDGEEKRRRGGNVDRRWTVREIGLGTALTIEDEDGDDYRDFRARAEAKVLEHLNEMGAEGWRLVQFAGTGFSGIVGFWNWPLGTHIFCRSG